MLSAEELEILRGVSAGTLPWRDGLYELELTDVNELLALLEAHQLPSPFDSKAFGDADRHALVEFISGGGHD